MVSDVGFDLFIFVLCCCEQEGQEGNWLLCFMTQDSLSISMESRCVYLTVQVKHRVLGFLFGIGCRFWVWVFL